MIRSRAAVAWAPGQPLEVTEIEVAPPKAAEVLVRIVATGVCHTDAFTLSGADPEGLFPAVLGHEGGGVVEALGEGVTSLAEYIARKKEGQTQIYYLAGGRGRWWRGGIQFVDLGLPMMYAACCCRWRWRC